MFSDRLKRLIVDSGKTQKDVSSELLMSQQRFNYYVLGKREPDYATLVNIAKYFGVTTDYLIGASDTVRPITTSEKFVEKLPRVERDTLAAVRRYKSDPYFPELISLYGEASDRDRALVRQILSEYSEKNSPALPVDAGESVG